MKNQYVQSNRVGIDAVILAAYFASTPIHQTLLLSNGATVTKYLALGAMISISIVEVARTRSYVLNNDLFRSIGIMALWFGISAMWSYSRSTTISALVSIASYFALMLIVCSKNWSLREKKALKLVLIGACTYYAITLIQSVGIMRRATIISGGGNEADQNILAMNIALGALLAMYYYITTQNRTVKYLMLAASLIIIIGIICTGSRGGLIALLIAIGYMLFKYKQRHRINNFRPFMIIFAVVVVLYILLNTDILGNNIIISRYIGSEATNTSGRMNIWLEYITALFHRPLSFLMGCGFGAANSLYADYYSTLWSSATHNDYLDLICSTGVIGLGLTISFIKKVWKQCKLNFDILSMACVVLALVGGLDVNTFTRYGWWNVMIFAYIGIGVERNELDRIEKAL